MRPRLIAVTAVAIAAAATPGHAATRTWQVGDAARLRVAGPYDVRVRTGVPAGVRATGPQDAIDRLVVDQRGDTIAIRAQPGGGSSSRDRTPVVIDVAMRSLASATLAGSGTVAIDRVRGDALALTVAGSGDLDAGGIDVGRLKLSVAGSGDLGVAGRAANVEAALGASGDIQGGRMIAERATVTAVGSGDVTLAARRTATISAAGSGDVAITGPAACTVSRRGSGEVRCEGRSDDGD